MHFIYRIYLILLCLTAHTCMYSMEKTVEKEAKTKTLGESSAPVPKTGSVKKLYETFQNIPKAGFVTIKDLIFIEGKDGKRIILNSDQLKKLYELSEMLKNMAEGVGVDKTLNLDFDSTVINQLLIDAGIKEGAASTAFDNNLWDLADFLNMDILFEKYKDNLIQQMSSALKKTTNLDGLKSYEEELSASIPLDVLDDVITEFILHKYNQKKLFALMSPITLISGLTIINSIAFSPDGKLLALGSSNGTVTIIDVATGKIVHNLNHHTDAVYSVAFSPDGTKLASGSRDGTVKIIYVATGKLMHDLNYHTSHITSVAFSPDGKLLASGSRDGTVKIIYVATGKLIHDLNYHTYLVNSVAFSPDGKLLASGSYDKTIKIIDVATGKLLHTLNYHTDSVNSVAFSPDGRLLASGSYDKTIKIIDVITGKLIHNSNYHTNTVRSVAFSPDGKLLASGSHDKTIKIIDVVTGKLLHNLNYHTNSVSSVAFSPDGKLLASGSWDNTVKIIPILTEKNIKKLTVEQKLFLVYCLVHNYTTGTAPIWVTTYLKALLLPGYERGARAVPEHAPSDSTIYGYISSFFKKK